MFEGARTTEPPAILRHNAEAYAELRPSFRLQPCAAIHRSWHLSLLADDPPTGPGPGRRSACSCGVVWRHAQTYPAAHGDAVRRGARGARQSHRGEVCAGPYGVSGMKIWSRRTHKGQGQHLSIRHHHPDGAYPDQHRQRLWNMTTAKPPSFFRRTPEEDGRGGGFHTGATRIGKWTFTPRSASCSEIRNATLEHESLEIDLSYSSSVFEDFLHTMSMIQVEFDRRSGSTARSTTTPVDEHLGGSCRV